MTDQKVSYRGVQEVHLSARAADALDSIDIVGDVGRVNLDMPRMAWLWFILRELPDSERLFPHGKWATIQSIESQLCPAARARAEEVQQEMPHD